MNIHRFKISVMCRVLFSIMLFSILLEGNLPAQAQETSISQLEKDLTGAWVLAGSPGNVNENPQVKGSRIKFISGGYWTITQANSDGEIIFHHGGTYTLDGDEYTERCEYANPNTEYLINGSVKFNIKIEGDTYTQIGIGNSFNEVWKRLKLSSTSDKTPPDQTNIVEQLPTRDMITSTTSATSQLAKDLKGAWILAGNPGNVNENPQVKGSRIKFIAGGHWTITQADSNGEIIFHHGGTYTLDGDKYSEKCEYANPNTEYLIDRSVNFEIKVEGDTYTQTGIGNSYNEVWKRLKVSSTSNQTSPDISQAIIVEQLPAQNQETSTTPATSQLEKNLTGAWVLAGRPGNVNQNPQVKGNQLKFIAGGQWCITQSDSDGEIIYHHGGTYTLNSDEYTEKVEYANENTAYLINTTLRFNMKVEGDFYTQTGIGNSYTQVWKRLNRSLTVGNYEENTPSLSVAVTMDDIELVKSLISEEIDQDTKNAALLEACSVGNLDIVKLLIDNGADVNAKNSSGGTPLNVASQRKNKDIVELLIDSGANINNKNNRGWTPLHQASSNGLKDIAELLIAKGADINAKHNPGGTPLASAVDSGHRDVAELLLDNGADVNAKGNTGRTPLNFAADTEMVELLISKGADVNNKNNAGQSILHFACQRGNKEIVELLIDNGADVNASNNSGRTPLDFATDTEMVELLLKHGAKMTLLGSVTSGNIEQVKTLISEITDPNAKNAALQEACSVGNLDIVKLLIDNGADVNARSQSGPALYRALMANHGQIVELLISNGADINMKNSAGQSFLHFACQIGNKEIAELLIDNGADVNASNNSGRTPLDIAEQRGYTEIVELLVKHGAIKNLLEAIISDDMTDIIKSAQTWKPAFTEWYGKSAPDFTITDITGKQHKISDYKGKNLILNFWATWCGPCRREIPDIIKLRDNVSEDELAILGISTEKGKTDLVKEFAEKEKMNYTILVSEGTLIPPYSEINAIPTTFIIDPEGNIKIATVGTLSLNDLNNLLKAQ